MIRHLCLLGLTLGLSISTSLLQADIINGSTNDVAIRSAEAGAVGGTYGGQNANGGQIRTGRFDNGDGENVVAVYVFQLPELGAVSDPFLSADLEFTLVGVDTNPDTTPFPDFNVDLYGLDSSSVAAVGFTSDFFFAGPGPDPNATLLEQDILTPADALTDLPVGLNSADISSYLNTQYDDGDGAGRFVFLRFSPTFDPDVLVDNQSGYFVGTANNSDASLRPLINFTTAVPEPSSAAVLLLGVSVISSRRRRRR